MTTITVSSGQVQSGVTLGAGDRDLILNGGLSISTFVGSGAQQVVSAGGLAKATLVASGGMETVAGVLRASEIQSGGVLAVISGGVASATTIDAGASDYANDGGILMSSLVFGAEVISSGGVASGAVNSGTQSVLSGGSAVGTNNFGLETVFGGGVAVTTTDYGQLELLSGGIAMSSVVGNGGLLDVHQGAVASDTIVQRGGQAVVESGGTARTTTINNGGSLAVLGGTVAGVLIRAGGEVTISTGAINNVNVQSGGLLRVIDGAANGSLLSGGTETLIGSATASRSEIFQGGVEQIGSGARDHGSIISAGGLQIVGLDGQAGHDVIKSGAVQIVQGALASGDTGGVSLNATVRSGGEIVLLGSAGVTVAGFDLRSVNLNAGGTIDLTTLAYSTSETVTLNSKTDVLHIFDGDTETSFQLTGDYAGETFHLGDDGTGGTLLTLDGPPCYCRGTRILTDGGERAVEDLRIGDRLVTASGAARPLRWIGQRGYTGAFITGNRDLLPVTFRSGALDHAVPHRDLSVSPQHAMFVDGVLIPAIALVNGDSVVQAERVDLVEYFHLELEQHDVIIAEGAFAESFVDDGSRGMFHNAAEFAALYPDARREPAVFCAPRVQDGPVLAAARQRIAARIAVRDGTARATLCRGYLERAGRDRITGWAIDDADPARRIRVMLRDHGVAIGQATAEIFRADLVQAGIGDGCHGFELVIPGGLSPLADHLITAHEMTADGMTARGIGSDHVGVTLPGAIAIAAAPHILAPAAPEAAGTLRGNADLVTRTRILGWAIDDAEPQAAVAVQVIVDGVLVASVLANRHRRDLEQAGMGLGRCAFEHHFTPSLSPLARHVVELRCEATGHRLAAPQLLEPAAAFDGALEQAIDDAVGALGRSGAEHRVLSFLEQQAARLRQLHAEAEAGQVARDEAAYRRQAMPRLRALVIDNEWPDPARDAGSQAILSHMQALTELGYAVSLVATRELDCALSPRSAAALAAVEVEPCRAPFYATVEEVLRRQARGFDLVYLHRVGNAARYLTLARDHQPSARILYSVADLHHLRLARQAAIEQRPELLAESSRMRLAECTAALQADAVLTHSPAEAAALTRLVPAARVHVAPWAVPVCPVAVPGSVPFADRSGLALIGNYAHAPNVDAAHWLVEQVMPLVWQRDPSIACLLAGAAMPDRVRALAGPLVLIRGHVADLAEVFAQVRLTVAPLRFGAGIKGKVLDSLAAGVPCIMSEVAAEGLDLPASLIGRDAATIAAAILRLYAGGPDYQGAVQAGLDLVTTRFSAGATREALRAAIADGAIANGAVAAEAIRAAG